MDAADALRHVRPRFALPEGTIYLDGNSLGPLPRGVTERVTEVIEREWGRDLITSWNKNGWMDHPLSAGRKIARLVGGGEGNVVVADSTSVNLFKVLGAALALRPGRTRIISETGNFPTDLYMIQVIRPIGAEGLDRRGPAGSCRLFLGPGFRLGACWNRLVETVKTRKNGGKGGKNGRDTA